MKKVDQIMKEMGFNREASTASKEAFIKYLIKSATGVNLVTPSEEKEINENKNKVVKLDLPAQMSFDEIADNSNKVG